MSSVWTSHNSTFRPFWARIDYLFSFLATCISSRCIFPIIWLIEDCPKVWETNQCLRWKFLASIIFSAISFVDSTHLPLPVLNQVKCPVDGWYHHGWGSSLAEPKAFTETEGTERTTRGDGMIITSLDTAPLTLWLTSGSGLFHCGAWECVCRWLSPGCANLLEPKGWLRWKS